PALVGNGDESGPLGCGVTGSSDLDPWSGRTLREAVINRETRTGIRIIRYVRNHAMSRIDRDGTLVVRLGFEQTAAAATTAPARLSQDVATTVQIQSCPTNGHHVGRKCRITARRPEISCRSQKGYAGVNKETVFSEFIRGFAGAKAHGNDI